MAEREVETGPRKRVGEVRPRAGFGLQARERASGRGRGAAGPSQPGVHGWRGGRRPEGGAARGSSRQVGQSSVAGGAGEGEGRGLWSAWVPSLSQLGWCVLAEPRGRKVSDWASASSRKTESVEVSLGRGQVGAAVAGRSRGGLSPEE